MEERKHIDRLYQEKFKDFEAAPREAVWRNISARLQEKERRRVVLPLWYRIAGVAAVIALLFNYATQFFTTNNTLENSAVATEQERNFGELNLLSDTYNENMLRSSIILQALMQDTRDREEEEAFRAQRNELQLSSRKGEMAVVQYPLSDVSGTISSVLELKVLPSPGIENPEQESPVANSGKIPLPTGEEDLFADEEIAETKLPSKRLRVTTTAAPVYFDNMGKGNSIDAQFANNQGSGEISMAYGVNLAYQISEKIKIRSGVSKVDLSYNTRDIAFTAAVNPVALSGINYRGDIPNYRIENRSVRPFSNITASSEFNRSSLASPASGYLNQRLGFIEVPLEIEYVLIDKKIGLNIIGGGSTLFLDDNMVSLNSASFSTELGEANNINNVSFSTNVGVGVDYKISPQFQLNLEPIFKYQINTFQHTSDIKPYYFGIYSGFSFKF